MKILGIIPARGGSKRLPGKNIKKLAGKPLIAWTIESAKQSHLDRIIVTTDDLQIAKVAKRYGVEVPFIRPTELAGDKLGIEPVLTHALDWLKKEEGYQPDAVALLMPTFPLRQSNHIDEAIKIFKKKKVDSVVSVIEARANANPHWILKKDKRGNCSLFNGQPLTEIITRSQDLPPCFSRNDMIYLLKPKNLRSKKPNLYGQKIQLYVMDDFYNSDINTPEDFFICLQKKRWLKSSEGKNFLKTKN